MSKVLFFDIETSPDIGYSWGKYEVNIIEFKQEWQLLSIAWKWKGDSSVKSLSRGSVSEKALVQKLWELLNEADAVVAHNGADFDVKKSRAKFIEFGLKPPAPFKVIDTKRIAKSQFKFNSNSLNDLGKLLKVGKKVDTGGFQLWLDCLAGKPKAFKDMEHYNRQDVVLLEKVYDKLKAWQPNPPALSIADPNRPNCSVCGSNHVQRRGISVSLKKKRERLQCQKCGHWQIGRIIK